MADIAEVHQEDHDHHMPGFFTRWFCSTNHKDIGTLYILVSFVAAIIGGAMSWYIRLELAAPLRVLRFGMGCRITSAVAAVTPRVII